MTPLTKNVWALLEKESKKYTENNPNFIFDENKFDEFDAKFKNSYEHIMKNYMLPSVENLDRHKVAALIIISLLETNVIYYKDLDEDSIFIGGELLALKVGLAYLVEKLNEKLSERNVEKKIQEFKFPNAQSCETAYMEIMCRNLYYAKHDYKLNPLDLADRLFLVEYIALTKEGIDPDVLKDY